MMLKRFVGGVLLVSGLLVRPAPAEVMLQYFNISWRELAEKMPELAEVGYGAMWLPPPTKASGGLSVGYDLWDPFDIGGKDQRNTISTRYGTESDLQLMVETAHRFGIKIYWDNIMNHRAFDIPGFNENTPIDIYPGLVPEDFHLRVTEDGFYRKWDNTRDWNDAWQVQNLGLSDLIDIAHENPNTNFGANEGDDHPKINFIRQPNNPELYLDLDLPFSVSNPGGTFNVYTFANKEPYLDTGYGTNNVGSGNGKFDWSDTNLNGQHDAGETSEPFTDTGLDPNRVGWQDAAHGYGDGKYNMGNPISEDVNALLIRAARWLMDRTYSDGLRLDAVKHVPDYFFGAQFGGDKDYNGAGYTGGAQMQFNITRGFSDWNNHRDSIFNFNQARDDAMMFGEHLGSPPPFSGYIDAGMRLKDAPLRDKLNGILGQPWGDLSGLDQLNGGSSFGAGVQFANSHDSDYSSARELQHAFYLTRDGYPNIYTDGNYKAETLGASGGAFPRHANTRFLGQFNDSRLPNAVYINEHFARGSQVPRWADSDVVAYERVDKRENGGMTDADGAVLMFMMNDNFSAGQYREVSTHFAPGSKLWQYSTGGGNYYATVSGDGKIKTTIPPGGYFAFSWRSPEDSTLWSGFGGKPITIYQNGQMAGTMSYVRKDGPDGDPGFNPYGVADTNSSDYAYTWTVPRITSATNLRFVARVDGSAENVMFKLNGGIDLNSQMTDNTFSNGYGNTGELFKRDNAPGINPLQGTDLYLGFEDSKFVRRQYREKFAAIDTGNRNVIGSAGAETYIATIGTSGFSTNVGVTGRNSNIDTVFFVYHDPKDTITVVAQPAVTQFNPAPELAANSNITIWIKSGDEFQVNQGYLYYTTDGIRYPEGAGGEPGNQATLVTPLSFAGEDSGNSSHDWWKATIPALTNGTVLRYKVSLAKVQDGGGVPFGSVFPNDDFVIDNKRSMMGVWAITNFNAKTVTYAIHNDYGTYRTGLVEGFNFIQARAYLNRFGRASIYNTFKQTFYYDVSTPTGQVVFPAQSTTLGSQEYGSVVRTDPSVREVWYNILDNNALNDDGSTSSTNGNGTNAVGQLSWAKASRVTPSLNISSPYPDEWRFTYRNIPSSGSVTMQVRLVEWTSSTNFTLSDAEGHYTTLQRLVTAAAPTQALFVAFPANDGDVVDSNYTMKVYFSNYLADNLSLSQLKDRFLIRINGSAQNRDDYEIIYSNQSGLYHELAFQLPNLYNGQVNFLHNIEVTHTTGGGVVLQASRFVRAAPAAVGPYVAIIDPLEFDLNGTPQVITLNDIPSPAPEDRSYIIQVETDLAASNVWIEFTGAPGSAEKVPSIETPLPGLVNVANGSTNLTGVERTLSGTVAVTFSNQTLTGTGTDFTGQLRVGNAVRISTNLVTVTQIVSATSATLSQPYAGSTVSGASAFQRPAFDGAVANGSSIKISNQVVSVSQVISPSNLTFSPAFPGATVNNAFAHRIDSNPSVNGNRQLWYFLWTNMTAGQFTFVAMVDTDGNTNTVETLATRSIRVILRQLVDSNPADFDDDDDGIYDTDETTAINLPESNSETWVNGDVHIWQIYGRSDPLSPDTDGDGLPDGLELGWSVPIDPAMTLTNTDTNGDGWKNFRPDLDPPFYNTVPDNGCVPGWNFNAGRTMLLRGGITDPGNPDTDGDGIRDGVEDWNRNGWVDGDGSPLTPGADKCSRGSWPDGQWDTAWTETDPNRGDTMATASPMVSVKTPTLTVGFPAM
jgi:glycosidase